MAEQENVIDARDVTASIGFLTRLPVRVDGDWAVARGARSAWAYPVAGLVVGGLVCLAAILLSALGVPAAMAAGLVLGLSIFVTGALHEDGLADTADGFWGGWTKERRLEIMKDSRIGAYGVLALGLMLLLRWQGYGQAMEAHLWALVAIPAASRAAMLPLMALPNARGSGVSASVGRPPRAAILLGLGIGFVALLPLGPASISIALTMAIAAGLVALVARAKIGGQTGDILGATQQVCEIAALVTLAALA
ncbi:MAG: adenosylcobinamide-GDP ribazoletransferase [Pseudomonadota bacterium]